MYTIPTVIALRTSMVLTMRLGWIQMVKAIIMIGLQALEIPTEHDRSPDISSLGDNAYRVAPNGGYDYNYFVYLSYG